MHLGTSNTHPIVETPAILPGAALAEVGRWHGTVAHDEGSPGNIMHVRNGMSLTLLVNLISRPFSGSSLHLLLYISSNDAEVPQNLLNFKTLIRPLRSFFIYISYIVSSNESKFQETGKWTMVEINNDAFEELDWQTCTIFTKGS